MLYVLTVLIEWDDGTLEKHQRSFGGFKRDRRALVAWLLELTVGLVVMESTGIYWKSLYAALEQAGIPANVVNARHARNVPGRKTDISDSEWLAQLGRFGWLKPSFIPPQDLRELPLVARYREKLAQILAGEKNRLHQTLDDAGIKLGAVVADIGGVSAQAMIEGLIAGTSVEEPPELAKGVLRNQREAWNWPSTASFRPATCSCCGTSKALSTPLRANWGTWTATGSTQWRPMPTTGISCKPCQASIRSLPP